MLEGEYRRCFELATEHGTQSVALPSLGTGAYGLPLDQATPIALRVALEHLRSGNAPQKVTFVLYGDDALAMFELALDQVSAMPGQA